MESFAPGKIFNILAISGSLRAHSLNTEVLGAFAILAPATVHVRIFGGLSTLPHFNPDLDAEGAVLPASVEAFRDDIRNAGEEYRSRNTGWRSLEVTVP